MATNGDATKTFVDVSEAAREVIRMLRHTCNGDEKALRELVLAIHREVFSLNTMNPTSKTGELPL
jgi:hypothetical protein